ncbi:MarR family winged helix-turn-helix transcriptional regulator [uncultured Eudoraea sp.]|jgi:DNA-binding MarR family transcriptional regulator|uniref:MarR family winged helix-turn-helix transcriptional regulator n=1 Tax=uncultured Eudoraea sp. TaxID=1035614 RepID=UPI0026369AB7|nr:MarR family transcriptional regulator [uncultured Eudoraea sp.]
MNVEAVIKTDKKIPLRSRTIIHLILIHNKVAESFSQALKPFGISTQQFNVLRILRGQQNKPANLSTINERMVSKMSNTTRLVDKLMKKGFVDRVLCMSNRRKVEITITKEGLKALSDMDDVLEKTEKEILINFSDLELEQLNLLFNKF